MLEQAQYCLALSLVPGIGIARFRSLTAAFGAVEKVFGHTEAEYRAAAKLPEAAARALAAVADPAALIAPELALAEKFGAAIHTVFDADYPDKLRTIPDPPLVLYSRGAWPQNFCAAVGIVGSRNISDYARRQTFRLAAEAAKSGSLVISGLAFGADASAHRGALSVSGRTLAVLAGGLSSIQPREHEVLACEMLEHGGTLIGETPLAVPAAASRFARRNRLIAALSDAVIVTEAGEKSGALITADYARKYGRKLFGLPGRVDNPQTVGVHRLLKTGAQLAESISDVLGRAPAAETLFAPEAAPPPVSLTAAQRAICRRLSAGSATLEQLAAELPRIDTLIGDLMYLELNELVRRDPDRHYRRTAKPSS